LAGASERTNYFKGHIHCCQVSTVCVPGGYANGLRSYLLNPYVFLPTLSLSSSSLQSALTLLSIKYAAEGQQNYLSHPAHTQLPLGRASPALFLLSVLLHIDLSTLILLLPILLLLTNDPHSHLASPRALTSNLRSTLPLIGECFFYTVVCSVASTVIAGGTHWIPQTWGATYVKLFRSNIFSEQDLSDLYYLI
jgi:phosphatidylinositol glycan class U